MYKFKKYFIIPSAFLGLGLMYQLNNRFLLSAALVNLANLSYCFFDTKIFTTGNSANSTISNTLNFNSGLNRFSLNNISFGFNYLLKK
jgi:hypothetical protein